MAEIKPVVNDRIGHFTTYTWGPVTSGDTCAPIRTGHHNAALASVQVVGTFGGDDATIEVSNDGTNYVATDVSLSAAGIQDFSSLSPFIKPVGAGDAGTGLTYTLVLWG